VELAGGFAAVADSQVRVFEHRDTMLAGWGARGRGLAHGTRDGAERKHGGVRAWHARQAATPSGGGMVSHARVTAWRAQARDERDFKQFAHRA
jgi:hypothetical protein